MVRSCSSTGRTVRLWIVGAARGGGLVRRRRRLGDRLLPTGQAQLADLRLPPTVVVRRASWCVAGVVLAVTIASTAGPARFTSVPVLAVGGLLSAFWTVPFYLRHGYMNDMGWEKKLNYGNYLFSRDAARRPAEQPPRDQVPAGPGRRSARCSASSTGGAAGCSGWPWPRSRRVAFLYMPQGRLWNARLLPFYYLALYLLGALGVAEIGAHWSPRSFAPDIRPTAARRAVRSTARGRARRVAHRASALPAAHPALAAASRPATAAYWQWGPLQHRRTRASSTAGRKWNFTGYEGKPAYPEYHAIIQTMEQARPGRTAAAAPCGSTRSSTTATARRWR